MYYNNSNELYHYGVPGMRWGKRRAIKKALKFEKKMLKAQDEANYQRRMAKHIVAVKSKAANASTMNSNLKGTAGGVANEVIDTARSRTKGQTTQRLTLSAVKSAQVRGAKAAKAQAQADKWKKKLDKVKEKKKIDTGEDTVAQYLLRLSTEQYNTYNS